MGQGGSDIPEDGDSPRVEGKGHRVEHVRQVSPQIKMALIACFVSQGFTENQLLGPARGKASLSRRA